MKSCQGKSLTEDAVRTLTEVKNKTILELQKSEHVNFTQFKLANHKIEKYYKLSVEKAIFITGNYSISEEAKIIKEILDTFESSIRMLVVIAVGKSKPEYSNYHHNL